MVAGSDWVGSVKNHLKPFSIDRWIRPFQCKGQEILHQFPKAKLGTSGLFLCEYLGRFASEYRSLTGSKVTIVSLISVKTRPMGWAVELDDRVTIVHQDVLEFLDSQKELDFDFVCLDRFLWTPDEHSWKHESASLCRVQELFSTRVLGCALKCFQVSPNAFPQRTCMNWRIHSPICASHFQSEVYLFWDQGSAFGNTLDERTGCRCFCVIER